MVRPLAPCLLALALAAPAAGQEPAPVSERTLLSGCTLIAAGDVDQGEDWVSHRCTGLDGIPVWMAFSDSARGWLGFGERRNHSGGFGLDLGSNPMFEWRGLVGLRGFVPFAVIVRLTPYAPGEVDPEAGEFHVFRLRDDETSCVIGAPVQSHAEALALADSTRARFTCHSEPTIDRFGLDD